MLIFGVCKINGNLFQTVQNSFRICIFVYRPDNDFYLFKFVNVYQFSGIDTFIAVDVVLHKGTPLHIFLNHSVSRQSVGLTVHR